MRSQVLQTACLDHKSLVQRILGLVLPLQGDQEDLPRRLRAILTMAHRLASQRAIFQVNGGRAVILLRLQRDDGGHLTVSSYMLILLSQLTNLSERQEVVYCDENPNGNNGLTPIGGNLGAEMERTRKMLIAHGVLAALAFVILFPAGAITIRLASFPGVIWFHAAFQAFAYLVYIAAFGLGVYLANEMRLVSCTSQAYTFETNQHAS